MTTIEANKIIADYMGDLPICFPDGIVRISKNYLSLDALVPIWEKLEREILKPVVFRSWMRGVEPKWGFRLWGIQSHMVNGETIQEAAAIATAMAIQELKGE